MDGAIGGAIFAWLRDTRALLLLRFEITSTITLWIVQHELQLLINRNYNKIWEEYDSGINYLTGLYIQLLS